MDTLNTILSKAGPRHGLTPDALPIVLCRAEALFPGADPPAAALIDRWLTYLKESEPYWFNPPPAPGPLPDISLPPRERLNQYRQAHPSPPKHPAVIFTPAQVESLKSLSPQEKLTRVRELAAAKKE